MWCEVIGMRTNEEKQLVTQALDALASAIEKGEREQLKTCLATLARIHRYSVGNVLPSEPRPSGSGSPPADWPLRNRRGSDRNWNRLGRRVRQGEKGIRIFAPIVWRKKKDDKQESVEGDETEELVRFRSVCVFDVAQTDGRPLPESAQARGEPGEYKDRLMAFATEQGIKVECSEALVSAHGLSAGSGGDHRCDHGQGRNTKQGWRHGMARHGCGRDAGRPCCVSHRR
jgi:hypothetical protein